MKTSLIILTYNEIIGVKYFLNKLPLREVDEYLAIDGGSTDGTIDIFEKHKIPYYIQSKKGRGDAFRLAFEKASGDMLIFFSPDGNEDPNDIPKFLDHANNGSGLVVASRFLPEAHNEEDEQTFKWRKWANQIFTLFANIVWNKNKYITDSINGYRAITRSTWETIKPDGDGYTIEYQTTIRSMKKGVIISEFPTYEDARLDNQIGSPSFPTGLAFLKLLYREIFNLQ
jgi:glycosyltransferase involved in cell wall biosynthesis